MNSFSRFSPKFSFHLSPGKYALLAGTLILTCTGLITRVLGFFYRIFLSRAIGAEGLGLYSMIHPVFGICFALCAGSIQTAISRLAAAHAERGRSYFRSGLTISLFISLVLTGLIIVFRNVLAETVLMEPRCAPLLAYMALSVPCCAIHACMNGYYYGMQKTRIPAFSQIVEQCVRIGGVFLAAGILVKEGKELTVTLAVFGHLIGEAASLLFTLSAWLLFPPKELKAQRQTAWPFSAAAPALMAMALPLMGNRLVLNLLSSLEAIWIPGSLNAYGLSDSQSISLYGVLTGMALPFILFPSAIFNSLSVLLLPTVAQAQSAGNHRQIGQVITVTIRYCLYVGILCIGVFTLFGMDLGVSVFKDENAGTYIQVLAWLCPFLYLGTTMGSILNGLGQTSLTFLHNALSLLLRLAFVVFGIPVFGIMAYLAGMLASELLLAILHLVSLKKRVDFSWNVWEALVKPAVCVILSIGIYRLAISLGDPFQNLPMFFKTAFHILILSLCYITALGFCHLVKKGKL